MEKNRRVAKAYCRVPVLTIDGSENGFDGYRIGLNGFDNTKRQKESADIKKAIGEVRDDPRLFAKCIAWRPLRGALHCKFCFAQSDDSTWILLVFLIGPLN